MAHNVGQDGQKGDGMPKRSRLGWRTRFFRCLRFALSLVGIWLQPLVVTKPAISGFLHGRMVADVAAKIERTRYSYDFK